MPELRVAASELILGGQKSGKTARAEALAAAWLARSDAHRAVYIATAQAWDAEMRERFERHRRERAEVVARMRTMEEPVELAHAIGAHSRADTLIVVDCLTLWLTVQLMPAVGGTGPAHPAAAEALAPVERLARAIGACAGPLVLISNEIEEGSAPPGRDSRNFMDALGSLNQAAAAACERVTLMAAGLPMLLKGQP